MKRDKQPKKYKKRSNGLAKDHKQGKMDEKYPDKWGGADIFGNEVGIR